MHVFKIEIEIVKKTLSQKNEGGYRCNTFFAKEIN